MRLALTNRHHWLWSLPKLVMLLVLWLPLPAGLVVLDWYGALVPLHGAPDTIAVATGDVPSRITSARGFVIGGLERGGGEWVPFDRMSDAFVRAVVASEDARFFYHQGVDPEGILRAFRANMTAGANVQGGSTITQQLAKSFVGDARTIERKLIELVVARRMEMRFTKPELFEAYANRIYFGAGAQGVGAAARVYFGVEASELDLAQAALLAALVPAPGRYNPFDHAEAALERRQRVLTRVLETGLATRAEVDAARAAPLGVRRTEELRVFAPEIERAAWLELAALDPARDWRRGGLAVQTGVDLVRQQHAAQALRRHLYSLDQRQGLRETLGHVDPNVRDAFEAAWMEHFGERDGRTVPALVERVDGDAVHVWAGQTIAVARAGWQWAVDYDDQGHSHGEQIDTPVGHFVSGDVVLLHPELGLVQLPRVEGAYLQTDLATGVIEAQLGGFDGERSEFDRATQGCRQPGSTFKPIVYSAALDLHYTPATLVRDGPLRVVLGPYEEWNPRNADGSFDGHITLWQALIWSRNLPTLLIQRDIRAGRTIQRARSLGLTTPMAAVESLALGASCVHPSEMVTVYSSFASGGFGLAPRLVTRVTNLAADQRYDGVGPLNPTLGAVARTGAAWETRHALPEPRVNRRNAFQMAWLLSQAASVGTASGSGLPYPFAGKTGTTNAYDAWFAGFHSRDVAVLWIGSDRNTRPLGRSETGGHVALPAWADAMLPPPAETPLLPDAPPGIVWVDIEPESGRLAAEDRWAVAMPFVDGTEPRRQATTRERLDRLEIDRLERDF